MIITCIKGGLLPDFNKCIPYGEHDLAMYIGENIYFVFYDILDCKTQTRFSISTFLDIDKEAHMNKSEIDFRLNYFKKHKKALISKALRNPEDSLFFNSIESEVLSKYFFNMKFACKVDIFINDEQIQLEEIMDEREEYKIVSEFIEFFNMCEYIDAKELAEIRKSIYTVKPNKTKLILSSLVIGCLGTIAGIAFGYKISSKKSSEDSIQDLKGQED